MNYDALVAKYDELLSEQANFYRRARVEKGYAVVVGGQAVKVVLPGAGQNGCLVEYKNASVLEVDRAVEIAANVGGVAVVYGKVLKAAGDQLGLAIEFYRNEVDSVG